MIINLITSQHPSPLSIYFQLCKFLSAIFVFCCAVPFNDLLHANQYYYTIFTSRKPFDVKSHLPISPSYFKIQNSSNNTSPRRK